ncbi:hypothetical protein N0B31_03620 [Salinirubellus salinus]|uniref:Uncharacterized protein n=1 Tax=Salinirubellus salinus TaxID=1364945 RepID=A0A9E7R4T7_9EURY|nr:hypothetical protein [Salinirubellus salinus]UWM55378.1 hypothetical protein N0B31_03620 [Salinirubellus salinus]
MKRRALLSACAATSASVGLAGCNSATSYLFGCRGVELALALTPITEDEALQLGVVRAQQFADVVEDALDGPVRADDDLAERLGTRTVVWSQETADHYRVHYEEDGPETEYTAERLVGADAARVAASADLDAAADTETARDLVARATDEEVEWCTRDERADAYEPVVEAVARQSGSGRQVYYLNDDTVTAPARLDGRYYRAALWADTAE